MVRAVCHLPPHASRFRRTQAARILGLAERERARSSFRRRRCDDVLLICAALWRLSSRTMDARGIGKKYDTSYEWPVSRVRLVLLHTKAISAVATILTAVSQVELGSKWVKNTLRWFTLSRCSLQVAIRLSDRSGASATRVVSVVRGARARSRARAVGLSVLRAVFSPPSLCSSHDLFFRAYSPQTAPARHAIDNRAMAEN